MAYFLLFLIWIAAAFFFPVMLRRFQIPWVTAVIFAGMLLGPHGLNVVNTGEVMNFLATIGLVFLMFTAGLDTRFSALKKAGKNVLIFSAVNLGIPFSTGILVGTYLGLNFFSSLVLGVCFSSSSVGLIVPMLRELNVKPKIKSTLVSAIFLEDVISLVLLAVLLKAVVPISPIPLEIFPIALLFFVLVVLYVIPIVQEWLFHFGPSKDVFAGGVRAVFITLALVALMAELIGVHAMVGGFLAGLTLSDMLKRRKKLEGNIIAISYGFLIPIFLLSLGMTTNLATIFAPGDALATGLIILSLIVSKSVSGYLGGRLAGFPSRISWGMGVMTIAQMSTTLATASLAFQYEIFDENIVAALVLLSIVTIIVTPLLTKLIIRYDKGKPTKFTKLWRGEKS
ncbi:MAG: cation:proton antiporter [Candidatus Bathyarchaeum sp.]|nr:MAG: cation:proton antiporter [Candidatus Bathyarchaeum sp.]